jgi:hypothetical protein
MVYLDQQTRIINKMKYCFLSAFNLLSPQVVKWISNINPWQEAELVKLMNTIDENNYNTEQEKIIQETVFSDTTYVFWRIYKINIMIIL